MTDRNPGRTCSLKGPVRVPVDRLSWRRWPTVVTLLATTFVLLGAILVGSARKTERQIAQEFRTLDAIGDLADAIHRLGLVHRVDVNSRLYRWPDELAKTTTRVDHVEEHMRCTHGQGPRIQLNTLLSQLDSLHTQQMAMSTNDLRWQPNEVVFQLVLDRTRKTLDMASKTVHEQGLKQHTAALNDLWSDARSLLVMACLLAVLLAWLAGMNGRLLEQSRSRAKELDQARLELERSHQELRQTMLSKEEKEVMIKEIHHRVKNNLQIVKSLIRFQMDLVQDPRTIELFNECVNRVSAMALVHEQSYLSRDLANIDVSTYLDQLVRDLCHVYTVKTRLELDVRMQIPTMGVDDLIPMGLLINEVISNSLKHAFNGRETGTIIVHLSYDPQGGIDLRIGDDGVGLMDRTIWKKPKSLGMELVQTLAVQLDTEVELEEGPGTIYRLRSLRRAEQRRA